MIVRATQAIKLAVRRAEARQVNLIDSLETSPPLSWMHYLTDEEIKTFDQGFQLGKDTVDSCNFCGQTSPNRARIFKLHNDDEEENAFIIFVGEEPEIVSKIDAL